MKGAGKCFHINGTSGPKLMRTLQMFRQAVMSPFRGLGSGDRTSILWAGATRCARGFRLCVYERVTHQLSIFVSPPHESWWRWTRETATVESSWSARLPLLQVWHRSLESSLSYRINGCQAGWDRQNHHQLVLAILQLSFKLTSVWCQTCTYSIS